MLLTNTVFLVGPQDNNEVVVMIDSMLLVTIIEMWEIKSKCTPIKLQYSDGDVRQMTQLWNVLYHEFSVCILYTCVYKPT